MDFMPRPSTRQPPSQADSDECSSRCLPPSENAVVYKGYDASLCVDGGMIGLTKEGIGPKPFRYKSQRGFVRLRDYSGGCVARPTGDVFSAGVLTSRSVSA
jgi:hypothetical protein